jgi:hypothetical protein
MEMQRTQVSNVSWSYKNADERISLELWDVVDVAIDAPRVTEPSSDDDTPAGAEKPVA